MTSSEDQRKSTSAEKESDRRARYSWTLYLAVLTFITLVPIGISFFSGGYKKPHAVAEAAIFTLSIGLIAVVSFIWVRIEKRR